MAEPTVHVDVNDRGELGRVVRITVDHTAKANILNTPLIEKLTATIESFHDDKALRVMILTGAGNKAFIGGVDIKEMMGLDPASAVEGRETVPVETATFANRNAVVGVYQ